MPVSYTHLDVYKRQVRHSSDLPLMVGRIRPGISAPLLVIREGKEQTLTVKLEALPDESKPQAIAEPPVHNRLGLIVGELPGDKRKKGDSGVLVKDVDEGPCLLYTSRCV